jgi:hypothetical protein
VYAILHTKKGQCDDVALAIQINQHSLKPWRSPLGRLVLRRSCRLRGGLWWRSRFRRRSRRRLRRRLRCCSRLRRGFGCSFMRCWLRCSFTRCGFRRSFTWRRFGSGFRRFRCMRRSRMSFIRTCWGGMSSWSGMCIRRVLFRRPTRRSPVLCRTVCRRRRRSRFLRRHRRGVIRSARRSRRNHALARKHPWLCCRGYRRPAMVV